MKYSNYTLLLSNVVWLLPEDKISVTIVNSSYHIQHFIYINM